MDNPVSQLLKTKGWGLSEGTFERRWFLLRYRLKIVTPPETHTHPMRLSVLWPYTHETSDEPPSSTQLEELNRFEELICEALEHDATAILVAVLTFEGSRHWVFYTSNVHICGERISKMPHYGDPYPLQMVAETEPNWDFFLKNLLSLKGQG